LKSWLLGGPPEEEHLGADDIVLERLLTGLRTRDGVDLKELESVSGIALGTVARRWLTDTTEHGLLELGGDNVLRATAAGLGRLDAVLRTFVTTRQLSSQA